jgi:hypothetical protein
MEGPCPVLQGFPVTFPEISEKFPEGPGAVRYTIVPGLLKGSLANRS